MSIKVDDSQCGGVCNTVGVLSPMTTIDEGTQAFERVGREIRLQRFRGNVIVTPLLTSGVIFENLAFHVVYDKYCNNTTPAGRDILGPLSGTPNITSLSLPNVFNSDRFEILFTHHMVAPAYFLNAAFRYEQFLGPTDQDAFRFEFDIDLEGRPSIFGTAAGGQPLSGALWTLVVGTSAVGAERWGLTGYSQLIWTDN